MESLPALNLKNLDKSQWKTYRFDEIAKSISERVDPNNTDLEVYVGLEHIDSESIHLKRSGTPDDVNGQKLRFYPGDMIFGRRRAYQRKAAVATTHGFCSAHALVLRANPEVIDPQLFPFFMHSDAFMHRAVDISVGSLSPTINWGALKHQKFTLPPPSQQVEITEILRGIDNVIERSNESLEKAQLALVNLIREECITCEGEIYALSELIDKLEAGVSVNSEEGSLGLNDKGILKTSAVSDGYFKPTEAKKVLAAEISRLKTPVRKDTIVISRMNTVELVGANVYIDADYPNLFLPDRLWQARIVNTQVNKKFLWFVLSSPTYRKQISDLCTGTSNSMKNISKHSFLELILTLPSRAKQDKIVATITKFEEVLVNFKEAIKYRKLLQKSLINQIF